MSAVQTVSIDRVIEATCKVMGVTRAEILSGSKCRPLPLALSMVAWIGRNATTLSYPQMGRALNRPHTTIIAAENRAMALFDGGDVVITLGDEVLTASDLAQRIEAEIGVEP